jgi:arylsulfatase A-like enzyme
LRADHVSAYGYSRPTTPNIDRLADRGVLFEGAFSPASWTLPSHVSMLTGLYPHQHGAEETYYRGHEKTLAEALRDRGYRTGAVSANTLWFARHRGVARGFVRFDDYFHSVADMASRTMLGRRFAKGILPRLGYEDHPGRRRAPSVNEGALNWIDKESGRPFFLFLNYLDSHDPYLPPTPYRTKFSRMPDPGGRLNGRQGRYYPELTPEELQGEVDAYDGAINYVDEHIGQLVAALEERGLMKNTILIVTSDHGESFGEHGLLMHLNGLYRETLHVPLIVVWPGQLPEKQRRSAPVSLTALPATVLELAGLPDQGSFPVPSLAGVLKDPAAPLADHCPLAELAQFPHDAIKRNPCYSGRLKSLVCGPQHYVVHEKLGEELFRWMEDPQELNNLTKTPEGRKAADEFGVRLRAMLGREPFSAGPTAGGNSR